MLRLLLMLLFAIPTWRAAAAEPLDDWADILVIQKRAREPLPALSAYGAELQFAGAYAVQKALVRARLEHDHIAGYKASLTDKVGRFLYDVSEPVAGVLLASGDLTVRREARLGDYRHLMVEAEVGFIIDRRIDRPVPDVVRLKPLIRDVVPVVELPDRDYEHAADVEATDLIATNVEAAAFIVGRPLRSKDETTINGIFVELLFNGTIVDRGRATNILGNPLEALLWLVNRTVANGWTIEPGQILITGAIGGSVRAQAGRYTARYRDLDDLEFRVTQGPLSAPVH